METKGATDINYLKLPEEWIKAVVVGHKDIFQFIKNLVIQHINYSKRNCFLAIDGFLGVEWQNNIVSKRFLTQLDFDVEIINIAFCYKPSKDIEETVKPYISCDQFFGRVLNGHLNDFLDYDKIKKLMIKIKGIRGEGTSSSKSKLIICYGLGAANKFLNSLYDFIFYVDITREEFVKRVQKEFDFFGLQKKFQQMDQVADIGLPVYLFKLLTYVYYPLLERYKKYLLNRIDYYIDGNISDKPKLIPREVFDGLLSKLSQHPFRLKPLYIPSPWGGQWLKKNRKLPKSMVNCAWGFEAVAPEMSVKVAVGETFLEIPFLTVLLREAKKIMGNSAFKKYRNFFPIRVHYDDSIDGDHMAIQVHPPTSYVKKYFNEKIGQDESYYVVLAGSDAKVFLGLKDDINKEEFYEAVKRAEAQGVPLEYDKYVHSIPSKPGDLFLIPAGTVHASGRNELVLEIGNNYGYTFHIYDYLRPDLNGRLRPIHSWHAFQVIKFNRKASWVNKHLKQQPRLIRSNKDGAEYLLGEFKGINFVVHRLEFKNKIDDNTNEKFHILTLIEGDRIIVQSEEDPRTKFKLNFSETVMVPACFGKYLLLNLGSKSTCCKVLKVLLR